MAVTSAKILSKNHYPPEALDVEPVFGCKLKCKQCCVGDLPTKPKIMPLETLKRQLTELDKAGLLTNRLKQVVFSSRGNPLSNARLQEYTAVMLEKLPGRTLKCFWNLSDVPSQAELITRTKGLNQLNISLDYHHLSGHIKRIAKESERTTAESKELGVQYVLEKIRWAIAAAKKNNFKVRAILVGEEREKEFFSQQLQKIAQEEEFEITTYGQKRDKRGSDLRAYYSNGLILMHDGTIDDRYPPATQQNLKRT